MAFALATSIITQSGTDTDATTISGLQAIAGVTSIVESGRTRLIIPFKLVISGTMTNTSAVAFTFTRSGTPANEVTITSTGRWNYKESRTVNGFTDFRIMPPMIFTQTASVGFNGQTANIIYVNGGIQDFAKVEVIGNGGHYWNGGTIILRDVIYNAEGLALVNDNQITTQSGNPTLDIDGFEFRGTSLFLQTFINTKLSRLSPKFAIRGFGSGFGLTKVLQDFNGNGTGFDLSIYNGGLIRSNNGVRGGGVTCGPWNSPNNNNNEYQCTSDLVLTGVNEIGGVVLFKAYHLDNNAGAPVGAGVTATNYTLRKTYNVLSVAGVATLNVLLAAGLNDGVMVRRSVTQTNDFYIFNCFSYLSEPTATSSLNLAGAGIKTATVVQLRDQAISEVSKATVDAYTTLDTLDKLYDRSKSFLFDNFAGETSPLLIADGAVINAGSKNIVIDSAAASVFAYNSGTNTITIKTSTLASGNKLKSLVTTGNVTITGNALVNIAITGNVTQTTPTNLTNVTITGTLTHNTASNTNVTYTGSTLATVNNSGVGVVTVKRVNSTLTPGTNVFSYLPTTLVFTLNGGRIRVLDNAGAEQYNQTSDGTFELPSSATGTWTYKIVKYGSQPITSSITMDGTIKSITATYIPDTFVVDTLVNVTAYTSLGTVQKVYDYYSYYLTTVVGIPVTKNVTLTASLLDLGNNKLSNTTLGVVGTTIGINIGTVSGVNILTSVSQTGITPTYPQKITDSTSTTNWVQLALNGGRIRILDNVGAEQYNQTTDGNLLLPSSTTGTWTYKIVKYGSNPIFGSFNIDGTLKSIIANYIPDAAVIDTLSNVIAYTSLGTSQKIYDWYSYYLTTSVGVGVIKSVSITSTLLTLGAYTLANSAVGITGNIIGINTAIVSGASLTTTGTQTGIAVTYPQQLTDSTGTTNWLSVVLTSGQVCRDTFDTIYHTASYNTFIPSSYVSAIDIYVTRVGYKKQVINIPFSTVLYATRAFTLIPDSNVVDVVTDFTSATLTNSQDIYDAFSQYQASSAGVLDIYTLTKAPGSIDFTSKGFELSTVNDFTVTPIKIKTTNLATDTYYSASNFIQGSATLGADVKIRALNLDSELIYTADSITFYPTVSDRNSATNPGTTITGGIYRYKFGSTYGGVAMTNPTNIRYTTGVTISLGSLPLTTGNYIFSLTPTELIIQTNNNLRLVNQNVIKTSLFIPASQVF
jgi:hypothetical protein